MRGAIYINYWTKTYHYNIDPLIPLQSEMMRIYQLLQQNGDRTSHTSRIVHLSPPWSTSG
jgi:hypothetical protein